MRRAAVLAIVVLALTGCGGGGGEQAPSPTSANGSPSGRPRALFVGACGSCHTLADAGTHGTAGPNLDELAPSAHDVQAAIDGGKGAMPAHIVGSRDSAQVARYVASVAGSG